MTFKEKYQQYRQYINDSRLASVREYKTLLTDLETLLNDCNLMKKDVSALQSKEYVKQVQEKLYQRIKMDFWKKEYLLSITNNFFDYFYDEWRDSVNRDRFLTADKFYDDIELDIKLLKYLQSGEDETTKHGRKAIADHFSISENALNEHLTKLQNGCSILGERVKIEELRRAKNTYDSTIHPLFMTLNLADMYFLSVVVPRLAKDTMYYETAKRVATKVRRQLSEYAQKTINPIAEAEGHIGSSNAASWEMDLATFEKSGKPCTILYGGSEVPLTGHFEMFSEENFVLNTGERMHIDYRKIMEIRKPD